MCHCNGSWDCPPEKTKYICNSNGGGTCRQCIVDGKRYEGNTRFKHVNGCIEYDCVCSCDGGWDCPGERAKDLCNTDPKTGCAFCDVHGKKYAGNNYFKHVNGCIEHNCVCNCDGSWDCPGERARDLCKTNATSGCYFCEIDGYLYQGNSKFDLVQDCYLYQGCDCKCDGGWTCAHTRGTYVCDFLGNEQTDCQTCTIESKEFRGNSMFYHDRGCIRYVCNCACDGSFFCKGSDARLKCAMELDGPIMSFSSQTVSSGSSDSRSSRQIETCRTCQADGKTYNAYETFQIRAGCNLFVCTCFCNGSYDCPPERTINKCLGPNTNSGGGLDATSGDDRFFTSGSRTSSSSSSSASGSTRVGGISGFDSESVLTSAVGVNTCLNCTYQDLTFEGRSLCYLSLILQSTCICM